MSIKVKICGTTSPHDARLAAEAGADFLGVIVHHPPSPRNVSRELAREIHDSTALALVALCVNQNIRVLLDVAADLQPYALQLHGDESPQLVRELSRQGLRVWKAVSGGGSALYDAAKEFRDAGAEAILVDARETLPTGVVYGGTGHIADWDAAKHLVDEGFRVILAGGLTVENVARAIETVNPWCVDVVSGVEATKGLKDAQKVHDFVAHARATST